MSGGHFQQEWKISRLSHRKMWLRDNIQLPAGQYNYMIYKISTMFSHFFSFEERLIFDSSFSRLRQLHALQIAPTNSNIHARNFGHLVIAVSRSWFSTSTTASPTEKQADSVANDATNSWNIRIGDLFLSSSFRITLGDRFTNLLDDSVFLANFFGGGDDFIFLTSSLNGVSTGELADNDFCITNVRLYN